ncbi:hypothetical protein [Thalassoporum mexicanum]|uniref:hypothetical protein n=1 Tax=Thalassoporum mexicanum TaxID=3457544 RepID=UPI0002EF672A|nr:hypothetical protein [Pseudanabaena sp. PCC 7367]
MQNYTSISKQAPSFPDYLDFQTLRAIGIEHLQKLSGKIWTDYNLHDPGVTILEVLCYAITDLGYRNNLDIQDLLAPDPSIPAHQDNNFFTPDEILTCNPVTELDIRKRLVDIQGVRNAWIKKVDSADAVIEFDRERNQRTSSEISRLALKGLYTVYLDLAPEVRTNACGQNYQPWGAVLAEVKAVLHSHRNLCEDIENVVVLGEEEIGLHTDIELDANADAEAVLVKIYTQIQNFLVPRLQFYTLQSLLDKGKTTAEIFAGRPSALPNHDPETAYDNYNRKSHGFIDINELAAATLPTAIHTSDLYRIILNVPGVVAINNLRITSYINGLSQSQPAPWSLPLTASYRPILGIDQSQVRLFKQGLTISVDLESVKRRYSQQQITYLKAQRDAYELDLPIPTGIRYDIADHYSIHHDFPLTYGISDDGLPETASDQRKAQAKQLKGYLVFFDQLLANYLKQLSQVRTLFSWDETNWFDQNEQQHTYISQTLNFPGVKDIIQGIADENDSYTEFLQDMIEDAPMAQSRRHRLLDHLLARFAETFTDYILVNYQLSVDADSLQRLNDKAHFLKAYPIVSRDRFRAVNYYQSNIIAENPSISGFQKRIEKLLGIDANPQDEDNDERLFLLEHILLRPRATILTEAHMPQALLPLNLDPTQPPGASIMAAVDPYSFWISVLFPAWPQRFSNRTFRQLIERTVRIEAPAHIAIKIGWLDREQMQKFKMAYYAWFEQLTIYTNEGYSCSLISSLNHLIEVISGLESVYPSAVLANAQGEIADDLQPIILR